MGAHIIQAIFPRVCFLCASKLSGSSVKVGLCRSCLKKMEVLPPESKHCMRRDSDCHVCAVYSGRIASLLIQFKKGNAPAAHRTLAYIFFPHLKYYLARCVSSSERIILTHPPGSIKSRLSRGYDQMNLICRSLARLVQPDVKVLSLFRRNASASQKKLNREIRQENMKHAISLYSNRVGGIDRESVVIILDDVITTGATLGKCRELLIDAGFRRVYCMALLTD